MSEDNDDSSKTEDPSQHRLEEAFKKGQVINSREVMSFFLLVGLALVCIWLAPDLARKTYDALSPFVTRPESFEMDAQSLGIILTQVTLAGAYIIMVPLILFVGFVFAAALLQNPFHVSWEAAQPKWEKVSLLKGIERLFSRRTVVEFIKNLIKIIVVAWVAAIAVWPKIGHIKQLGDDDVITMLGFMMSLISRMMIGVVIIMFFMAILDYLYQRFEFMKSMRMSKQEVKEEYKQQEGDPHIKQRVRQLRMERSRKRMMAAVPTADVIITNPTHFAVALKYDADKMAAPLLVAKGVDLVAARIRDLAKEHDIPLVENKPLARVLYDTVEIDSEIPVAHYKAVAEIIGYVYKLRGKAGKKR